MVEVPPRELARRDAAGDRVQVAHQTLESWTPPLEDCVVHDLVQQHGEIEDGKSLDERERNPDQRMLEADEAPRREPEDGELARGDRDVTERRLAMQLAHQIAGDGAAELGPERGRHLSIVVR